MILIALTTSYAQDNTEVGLPEGAIARLGKGGITVMKFSPDGKRLAVGTNIGVWLYDVQNGKETLLHHEKLDKIRALAFSPNGELLAIYGRYNSTMQLWNLSLDFNQIPITFPDRPGLINELLFAQDNKTLLGLGELGYMAEWDIKTGDRLSTKNIGPRGSLASFSPDGKTFVYGDPQKNEIRIWDAETNSLSDVFKVKSKATIGKAISNILEGDPNERNRKQRVEKVTYSPDKKTIASAHVGNTIRIWDTTTKEQRFNLKGHRELVNTFAFSPDSKILASGGSDNEIILWDVNKGHRTATLSGHLNSVNTLDFSPTEDGLLASGSSDGTVRFWDTKTHKERSIITTGHTESIKAIAFSKDNTKLCAAASNGTVQIWDVQIGKKLPPPSLPHYDSDSVVALSQDATLLACNGVDIVVRSRRGGTSSTYRHKRETRLSSLPTGDELISFPHTTVELAISPDNNILAAVNPTRQVVQVWEINTGTELFSFGIALSLFEKLTFSPNSKYLFMFGDDEQPQMWDVTTQQKINIPNVNEIGAVAFSPDNTTMTLIHSNADDRLVISQWRITPTGLEEHKEIMPKYWDGYTVGLLFSPDGKILLRAQSNGRKKYIILWDIDTSVELGTVFRHIDGIETLAFSHDGKTLASVSENGTVLLWDWEKVVSLAKENKEN